MLFRLMWRAVQLKAAIEQELASSAARLLATPGPEDYGTTTGNQLGQSLISEEDKKLTGSYS